jgi:signal transduction histidine kinase
MIKRLDALNERVNDMLRYAKPRSPQLARVPLRPLLEATSELAKRDPAMGALEIAIEGGTVSALGDAEMLREVFLNLVLNAGQAMEGRGTVRLAVHGGPPAVVRVVDTGPGMSEELRERVFEPFFTTKRAGTGLGLAIVRRLLELQGATVEVEATSAAGTTMRVTMPAEPPQR